MSIEASLSRHKRIALQFSGGKDSMACLYLLRPHLDRITVYWLNAGDEFEDTHAIINQCREFIPHFTEIKTDSLAWRAENGIPSDLVPTFNTQLGMFAKFGDFKISDRFACCYFNLMEPMHAKMLADGVTCIIRGTKACDMPELPRNSGYSEGGVELYYPLENWTHAQVFAFLREVDAPIHPCYDYGDYGVTCQSCTAWWNESQHKYRRARDPELHGAVSQQMTRIRSAIDVSLAHLSNQNGDPGLVGLVKPDLAVTE